MYTTPMNSDTTSFYGLGIAPGILQTLDRLKLTIPTPIQQKAIPIALGGKDVIGIAQTGTGKTLAFGIPMIQGLSHKKGKGLIVVPTRELAIQVNETIVKLATPLRMKTAVLIGGENMGRQIAALKAHPRIIIATPGRLIDHITQNFVKLNDVDILVLDEADRMFDMGFAPQIERIMKLIPKVRQTLIFSATMPPNIVNLASTYMDLPVRTEIAPAGTASELVSQELFVVNRESKEKLVGELLKQYTGSVLFFVRTKIGASKITRSLRNMGYNASEIHSDRSLSQRKEALAGFKSGKYRVLVATDIAARGIDVKGIELVINYDLPDDPENYVHRIGRAGRAGHKGHAISIATREQKSDVDSIEKILRKSIPVSKHPHVPGEEFAKGSFGPRTGGYKGRKPFRPGSSSGNRRSFGSSSSSSSKPSGFKPSSKPGDFKARRPAPAFKRKKF